jgi:uncharacterized MnhB-related membrane protein
MTTILPSAVTHDLADPSPVPLHLAFSFLILYLKLTFRRWSVGSGLFLASFAAVMGPMNYVYHLLSTPRLPFTTAYFGSIVLTLVFAIKLQNTILTLAAALVQIACLLWYLVSYFPMGSAGLRLATTFGARQATAWMSG